MTYGDIKKRWQGVVTQTLIRNFGADYLLPTVNRTLGTLLATSDIQVGAHRARATEVAGIIYSRKS